MSFESIPNSIRSLRLPGGALAGDTLAARLRLEALLQDAVFALPGLPPTALLVINHLQDRQLARLLSADRSRLPPASLISDCEAHLVWQRAFSNCIQSLASQSAQPLHGPVPPGAPAVLFFDESEMLACLALDLLHGQAGRHWWWKAVFPSQNYQASLVRELSESPQLIPPMIEQLARQGQSATFALYLGERSCLQLAEALLSAHRLSGLVRLVGQGPDRFKSSASISPPAANPYGQPERERQPEFLRLPGGILAATPVSTRTAQLQALLEAQPESRAAGLSIPARFFLAVSLSLSRAPAALRARAGAVPPALAATAGSAPLPGAPRATADPARSVNSPAGAAGSSPRPDLASKVLPGAPIETPIARATAPAVPQQPDTLNITPARVSTDFGGLFYLLNLAVYMGIYSDFTQPAGPGWAVSPWDLLALLGRHWLGERFTSDPLRVLLARLSGRQVSPGRPAFKAFMRTPRRQAVWKPRKSAAAALRPWHYRARSRPQGRFSPPLGWLEALNLEGPGCPTADELALSASSWLAALASVMRRRLALAFGHDHPLDMINQPALVWVSSTRLDIHFNLASHLLEVRLSGLDRDLGWLPNAGRSIYYHYDL